MVKLTLNTKTILMKTKSMCILKALQKHMALKTRLILL